MTETEMSWYFHHSSTWESAFKIYFSIGHKFEDFSSCLASFKSINKNKNFSFAKNKIGFLYVKILLKVRKHKKCTELQFLDQIHNTKMIRFRLVFWLESSTFRKLIFIDKRGRLIIGKEAKMQMLEEMRETSPTIISLYTVA